MPIELVAMVMISMNSYKFQSGFTLVETLMTVVLVGVLSVASISYLQNDMEEIRFDDTVLELEKIKLAMIGDESISINGERTNFGFQGDIGGAPTTLSDLITQGAYPVWSVSLAERVPVGWNGPYLQDTTGVADITTDSWGNSYTYDRTGDPITVISLGADNASGGTGLDSDITVSIPYSYFVSDVYGFISEGSNPYTFGAEIELYQPDGAGAIETLSTIITAAANGYFSFSNVSMGARSIKVFMPNKATSTSVIGPATFMVDKPNYMIPASAFSLEAAAAGTGGGGACTITTDLAYVAGSRSFNANNKTIYFNVDVANNLDISAVTATFSLSSRTFSNMTFPVGGYNCTGGAYSPCPGSSATELTFSTAVPMTTGAAQSFSIDFSNRMDTETSLSLYYVHSLGCSTVTINDF